MAKARPGSRSRPLSPFKQQPDTALPRALPPKVAALPGLNAEETVTLYRAVNRYTDEVLRITETFTAGERRTHVLLEGLLDAIAAIGKLQIRVPPLVSKQTFWTEEERQLDARARRAQGEGV